jgi:hypothetical protein
MPIFVHFDRASGAIRQASLSNAVGHFEGCAIAVVTNAAALRDITGRHKVDIASVAHDAVLPVTWCRVVEMTELEWRAANAATPAEVKLARDNELRATDEYVTPDRPLSDAARLAWQGYRQALRDLGARDTARAMIAAWPARPDGRDPIVLLRARVA